MEQRRGTAYFDLQAADPSTASGAHMFFSNSGKRRLGSGQYTVAATDAGAFVISQGRLSATAATKFRKKVVDSGPKAVVQVSDGTFNITTNGTDNVFFCVGTQFDWFSKGYMNRTWGMMNGASRGPCA